MNSNALVLFLALVALSAVIHGVNGRNCSVHTYHHGFVYNQSGVVEACEGEVRTCMGGCSGSVQYKMHESDGHNATHHCKFGLDCCQAETTQLVQIDFVNCVPLDKTKKSKGPFLNAKTIHWATSCKCTDDCMQGQTIGECSSLHERL